MLTGFYCFLFQNNHATKETIWQLLNDSVAKQPVERYSSYYDADDVISGHSDLLRRQKSDGSFVRRSAPTPGSLLANPIPVPPRTSSVEVDLRLSKDLERRICGTHVKSMLNPATQSSHMQIILGMCEK